MRPLFKRLALSFSVLAALVVGTELVLRAKGYGAIPSVWFDPEVGTRFHPNQVREIYGPKMAFLSKARINAQGFRGQDFDDPRVRRARRIAVLGDSFVFGWGVEDDEPFPELLHGLLDQGPTAGTWQVLNFGMPGYNTWQELRIYERAVRPERPEVVVVAWYLNDLDPFSVGATGTLAALDHPLAGTALLDWYVRKLRPKRPNYAFEGLDEEAAKALKEFYDQNWDLFELDCGAERARPYVERNLLHLGQLFDTLEADKVRPLLLVFPSAGQVVTLKQRRAELSPEEYSAARARIGRIQADLAQFSAARGTAHVDLLDVYVESEEGSFDETALSHPGVHGHKLAAEAVLEALRKSGVIP